MALQFYPGCEDVLHIATKKPVKCNYFGRINKSALVLTSWHQRASACRATRDFPSAVSSITSVNTPVFWANFTTTIWDWTSNTHTVITILYCIYTAVQKYYTVKRIHAQNTQKGKNATIPKPAVSH